jgi:hypothetical protein
MFDLEQLDLTFGVLKETSNMHVDILGSNPYSKVRLLHNSYSEVLYLKQYILHNLSRSHLPLHPKVT